ncbi:hypothetical protein BC941DRAFT_131298 [Chlamydoabsidia padenii]|nr:hypothetical protein BC941DRAFT_131298 [Chlamydoabsidia padenii]
MVPNFTRNNNHHQSAEATQYTDDNTLTSPLYNQSQYTYTHSQELSTPGPSEQQQQQQQISMVSSPHLLMLQQSLCHSNQSTTKDNFINTSTGELNLFEDITSIYSINNNNNTFPQHPALPTPGYPTTLDNSVTNANQIRPSERGTAGFVSKLYQSLQGSENGCKYAGWCHHNDKDMFVIVCIPKFTDYVLPRLFKHRKFASFVRQLNVS